VTRHFNLETKSITLKVQLTKPGWVIKSLILESEACFPDTGLHVSQPLKPQSQAEVQLSHPKF
jgi:hypothetical protein